MTTVPALGARSRRWEESEARARPDLNRAWTARPEHLCKPPRRLSETPAREIAAVSDQIRCVEHVEDLGEQRDARRAAADPKSARQPQILSEEVVVEGVIIRQRHARRNRTGEGPVPRNLRVVLVHQPLTLSATSRRSRVSRAR